MNSQTLNGHAHGQVFVFQGSPGPSFVCLGLANCPFGVKGGPLLLLHTAAPSGTRECWR